jgi:hypothetical protein
MLNSTVRDGDPGAAVPAGDRLSLGQLMILIAGAALGLGLLPLGPAAHLPVFGPNGVSLQGVVIAVYGTVSGVTMAAVILLVASWWRSRRPWGPAAVSLFVAGVTAWLFLPMVAAGWIRNSGAFEPFSYLLRILLAHSPEAYAFEAYYHFWPVACLALFLGCSLSGQTKRWWALAGWWAEWLGMWVLAVWSIPSVPIMAGFFNTYFR